MSDAADFTVPEELRFLALQCAGQAEGTHRDQDALFLIRLGVQLAILGDTEVYRIVDATITEAHEAHDSDLAGLTRLCGTILNDRAARIERAQALAMGDAA